MNTLIRTISTAIPAILIATSAFAEKPTSDNWWRTVGGYDGSWTVSVDGADTPALLTTHKEISILIIKGNMYHKIQFPDTEQVFIIHVVNNIYGCESISINELEKYELNRFNIENYDKPLKCIGSFKIDELKELAKKLNIEINNKINKPELYQNIQSKINSFFDK